MTSPAGAISGAPYRGGAGWTQGYAPAQQTYRYTAPLAAQPAYAYTQHTTTTVSARFVPAFFPLRQVNQVSLVNRPSRVETADFILKFRDMSHAAWND
jgi:hypothetical protein